MTHTSQVNENELDSVISETGPRARRRFQFSLASLLWLTTFAVCLAALLAMYRELRQARDESRAAREEVQKYRNEMGYLDISDPNKIYAHGIRTVEPNKWSWRVHVPDKVACQLCVATNGIPAEGLSRGSKTPGGGSLTMSSIGSGELLVDAFAGPTQDGKWRLTVKVSKSGSTFTTQPEMSPPAFIMQGGGVNETTQECVDVGSPLVLLR